MANTINADNGVSSGSAGLKSSSDGTGILALQTNGTTAVTVDASQNVGIGTASPNFVLDVIGTVTTNAGGVVSVGDSTSFATGVGGRLLFKGKYNTAGNYAEFASIQGIKENATDGNFAGSMLFNTRTNGSGSWTERMRIDSSGNVGIGTTSLTRTYTNYNLLAINGSSGSHIRFDANSVEKGNIVVDGNAMYLQSAAQLNFGVGGTGTGTNRMYIDGSGALILVGSTAQKATGTTWSNPSDQRLKNNIRDYAKGTAELMQVRVREWEYNGKGGTTDGMKGLGVVADEVMTVLPDTVENYNAKLNADDEETTAIKKFDATEITWLLVKTVQEQQAIITALTARIEALEAK